MTAGRSRSSWSDASLSGEPRLLATRGTGGRRHDTQRDCTPTYAAVDPLVIALRLALAEVAERRSRARLHVVEDEGGQAA